MEGYVLKGKKSLRLQSDRPVDTLEQVWNCFDDHHFTHPELYALHPPDRSGLQQFYTGLISESIMYCWFSINFWQSGF